MVQPPLIEPGFPEFAQRVGIKFQASVPLAPIATHVEQRAPNEDQWRALHSRFPGIRLVPFFVDLSAADLQELERRAIRSDKSPGFASWRAIVVPRGINPAEVVRAVASWPELEVAYLECCGIPPSVNPSDDPRSSTQGYLEPARRESTRTLPGKSPMAAGSAWLISNKLGHSITRTCHHPYRGSVQARCFKMTSGSRTGPQCSG